MSLLEVVDVGVRFGGVRALTSVNMTVYADEITGLIGPNGAGKTTLFNVISGVQRPTKGAIRFAGSDITRLPPHRRAKRGLSRTFQRVQLFRNLTVAENVLIGIEATERLDPLGSLLRTRRVARIESNARTKVEAVLQVVGIQDAAGKLVRNLPLGLQRQVELARALAQSPRLLLLDEPASGLDEAESAEFCNVVLRSREELGLTVVIVEHDMEVVKQICDQLYVLDFGRVIAHGVPDDVTANDQVRKAYLGEAIEAEVDVTAPIELPVANHA